MVSTQHDRFGSCGPAEDTSAIHDLLSDAGIRWDAQNAEFKTPEGIAVQFLIAGERAGRDCEVLIAEPLG